MRSEQTATHGLSEYSLMEILAEVESISWTVGAEQAEIKYHSGRHPSAATVQVAQVYRAFHDQQDRVRRLVALLENKEVENWRAQFELPTSALPPRARWVEGCLNILSDGEEIISLALLSPDRPLEKALTAAHLSDIPVGLLYVEPDTGAIIEANPPARELLAMPDDDPSNIRWQHTPEWLAFIQLVNEAGTIRNRMLEISSGSVWGLFSAVRQGPVIAALVQDVSPLQSKIQTLQKVNIGLDNFVYHASHDLRAPLRSMQGLITLLRTETNSKERDKFVELIEGSIKRLDAFLVDLLSISRSNRPERRPLVKINFMLEVEKAVSSFFHLGDNKNLEVSTRISQPINFVSDLTQVRVILNNIISNAFKYRRYGVRKSRIKIEINVSRRQATIKISDNGEGIAEEHLPHIFDMFYRATSRSEGSGLGLYIVRETVEKLRGTIGLRSKPKQGTTFKVTLPNQYPPAKKS